jgi:hypothetical protein
MYVIERIYPREQWTVVATLIKSLSKTKKYEDVLDNFCPSVYYLARTEFESLVVVQRVFPLLIMLRGL